MKNNIKIEDVLCVLEKIIFEYDQFTINEDTLFKIEINDGYYIYVIIKFYYDDSTIEFRLGKNIFDAYKIFFIRFYYKIKDFTLGNLVIMKYTDSQYNLILDNEINNKIFLLYLNIFQKIKYENYNESPYNKKMIDNINYNIPYLKLKLL